MNQAKKQRLVGTVVLVALAVILVPMILDFSRQEAVQRGDIVVPPAPDVNKMQVLPLNVWSKKIDPQVKPEPVVIETPSAVEQIDEPAEKPEPSSPEVAVAKKETLKEPSTSQPESPASKVVVAEEVLPKPDVAASPELDEPASSLKGKAWMVQVGSFSTESKAFIFRNKLREMNYSAYIVPGENSAGKRFFRVRVGPEILHSKAEAIRKRLKKDTGLDGLVMRFR